MKPDSFTRTEADARDFANLAGRIEDFGDSPGDQEPNDILARANDEWHAQHRVVAWWCIRCDSGHYSGSPDLGCPDCGLIQETP